MRLSRDPSGTAALVLRDGQGRDRIRLAVPAEGEPVVETIAVDGTVTRLGGPATEAAPGG